MNDSTNFNLFRVLSSVTLDLIVFNDSRNFFLSASKSILNKIDYFDSVYFVHSYAAFPKKDDSTLAYCDYNGINLTSVVRNGNLYGCQFHPERSGPVGLKIIKSFCNA